MNTSSKEKQLSELARCINSSDAIDTSTSLEMYQKYICVAMEATAVTWCALYKGPYGRDTWYTQVMNDWKVFDMKFPIGQNLDLEVVKKNFYAKAKKEGGVGAGIENMMSAAGQTRAQNVENSMPFSEWEKHWEYDLWIKQGIGDRMSGAFFLSEISESHVWVDRAIDQPRFKDSDKEKLIEIMNRFPRVQRWWMLERGLLEPSTRPLSPREKEVLKLLLQPKSESEIANHLNLAAGTVHNYIVEIYKVFQVGGRYELIQLWLQ